MARLIIRMVRNKRARCIYIATTKEHARELLWEKIKDTFENLGMVLNVDVTFNETRLVVTLIRNGSTLKLTGADDKKEIDKLRGMSFHEVAIDEAASHDQKLLDWLIRRVVGPRMGEFSGSIVLFGSPGHDLRGIFYEATGPASKEHRPYERRFDAEFADWKKWSSHHWTVADGAEHVPALKAELEEHYIEKDANGWSDDHPVWRREYLGKWAADDTAMMFRYRPALVGPAAVERGLPDGTPWNQWDPERVGSHQFAKLPDGPTDWQFAYGFDMGHSDPFAVVVLAFSPSDTTRTIYHVYSFEKTKMYIQQIAQLLLGIDDSRPTHCAPHERPTGLFESTGYPIGMVSDVMHLGGTILDELVKVYGIAIQPAEQKAKFAGIELCNGDLLDGRIKILKGSALEDQLSSLQWQPDEFGRLREPKGVPNHSVDAFVYARRLIAHLFDTGTVEAPPTRGGSGGSAPPGPPPPPPDSETFEESGVFDTGGDEWDRLYR